MRKLVCFTLVLGAILVAAGAHAVTISKPPDVGAYWQHLDPTSGKYVYADSFIAPSGTDVPVTLGTWLLKYAGSAQSARFEIWGDDGGPDHSTILATTGSVAPAVGASLGFFSYPVASVFTALTPGTKYWFVVTVIGESATGELQVGGHTQNSVYQDDGTFAYSNDPSGVIFNLDQTPEMAFQVGLSDVLLLDAQCGGSFSHYPVALYLLDEPYNVAHNDTDFYDLLTSGIPWRAVLVDEYDSNLSAGTESALATYIGNGGHVGIDYYDWSVVPSFAATFDATYVSYLTTSLPVSQLATDHRLFTTPVQIPDPLNWTYDYCFIVGAKFDPTLYGREIAYFGSNPVAPQARASGGAGIVAAPLDDAAIIVGNGGRTVLFGGTLGNYNGAALGAPSSESAIGPKTIVLTQGDWMAENIADYLLHVIFVDGFESTDFGAWSSETGGIFLAPQRGAAKH